MTSSQIDTSIFKGKCPLCSAQLVEDEQAKEFVVCSQKPKEYRIKKADFEAAWEEFDKLMPDMPRDSESYSYFKPAIFSLMSALLNNNVAEEAPPVDQTKWIIE